MDKINSKIPGVIKDIAEKLENAGFEAFLVGGCIRDLIMNREPKDWDLTTNAKPDQIIRLFDETFYENQFGTVGIKTDSLDPKLKVVEVTPYRIESKYKDHRHPDEVIFSTKIEEDLQRRDFTINAIAYSIGKGHVVDLYKGQEDIKDKVIRAVGDASTRFEEDALRMMRAVRFSAELGFTISTETLMAVVSHVTTLKNVSRERIKDEFVKIIMSDNPMIGLEFCQRIGILEHISPNLTKMVGVDQNKDAHLYDVWEHSLRALQHSADKGFSKYVRIAALFHDIAKPATKRTQNGKTTFFGHEVVGERVTRETLENLKFDKETIENVSKLVRWHMFFSDTEQITPSAVRRLIQNVGQDSIWELINLRKCDRIGTGTPKEEPYRLRKFKSLIEEVMRDPISVSMLKINGNTLISQLKINAGPKIGRILNALLDEVLENPENNTEMFLVKRATELSKLDDSELIELANKGKVSKEDADNKIIEEIRKKNFVK